MFIGGERVKAGIHHTGRQRFRCKSCGCHYTRSDVKGVDIEIKRQAMHLYLEGLGFRAIGPLLGVRHVAGLKWVESLGEKLARLKPLYPAKVERLGFDEIWHYGGKKRDGAGYGLSLAVAL